MPRGVPKNPRFKKAAAGATVTPIAPIIAATASEVVEAEYAPEITQAAPLPRGWAKGALLNVRNNGAEYRITLYPEEFDPQQPERCLHFTNPAECQNFVSQWYSRESHDPRAR